ncbi:U-box domain-containing protein 4 [Ananas comosus]|uniref:U-box domain-containing protein 4 n=1 Tax=Ananas comosus TaxID=4615 RepID=A0A199WAM5_ANACO|nr:U-box domain-containing protein 4 [Ananas comosus]
MVSLTDTQISASQSQSPCASSVRIQRLLGRSMRTVRSNLFKNAPVRALDPPEPSGAVSEELTDSFVDVRLRELAAAGPSSAAGKAARDLLELSGEFSDYSSFSSDISGELERLAGAAPRSDGEFAAASALLLRRPELEEPPRSEALDWYPVERLEPVVRACVERLRASEPAEARREAAARLRLLAKHRSELRELIGASGAIPALVELLRSTDPAAQEGAATALLNLSLAEANKAAIAAAGAIKPLVYVLRTGTAAAKQNAACALLSLSTVEEHRGTIGACGAIPPLVSLLVRGTTRGKKDALAALYKLCAARRNKERAVSAGAVAPLVAMVAEQQGGTAEKAMVVLGSLAAIADGRDAIVDAGGIPALVEAIEDGPPRGKEFAVVALLQLCADSPRNRALLVREGAIPPLVALSQRRCFSVTYESRGTTEGPRRRSAWQDSQMGSLI